MANPRYVGSVSNTPEQLEVRHSLKFKAKDYSTVKIKMLSGSQNYLPENYNIYTDCWLTPSYDSSQNPMTPIPVSTMPKTYLQNVINHIERSGYKVPQSMLDRMKKLTASNESKLERLRKL